MRVTEEVEGTIHLETFHGFSNSIDRAQSNYKRRVLAYPILEPDHMR